VEPTSELFARPQAVSSFAGAAAVMQLVESPNFNLTSRAVWRRPRGARLTLTAWQRTSPRPPAAHRSSCVAVRLATWCCLPCFSRKLRARFGKAVDVIASGPWCEPLLAGHPAVGRLMLVRSRRTPYWLSRDQQTLVSWLRGRGAGPTWFCDRARDARCSRAGVFRAAYVCDSTHYPFSAVKIFADRYLRLGALTPAAFEGLIPPAAPGGCAGRASGAGAKRA